MGAIFIGFFEHILQMTSVMTLLQSFADSTEVQYALCMLRTLTTKPGPRHVGVPHRLIIWRPFKLIFFKRYEGASQAADNLGEILSRADWYFEQ
jgi:hypothetical protein